MIDWLDTIYIDYNSWIAANNKRDACVNGIKDIACILSKQQYCNVNFMRNEWHCGQLTSFYSYNNSSNYMIIRPKAI